MKTRLAGATHWAGWAMLSVALLLPSTTAEPADPVARDAGRPEGAGPSPSLLLTHGVVFDGLEAARPDAVVAVRDGRVEAVAASGVLDGRDYDTVIDLEGRSVVPGLIDAHVHVLDRLPELDLGPWLRAGVTTLVDVASQADSLVHRDPRARPRRFAAGPILTAPGGYPRIGWSGAPAIELHSAADAAGAVRDLARQGVDLVKVAIEAGFAGDLGAEGSWPVLGPQALRAVVEQARLTGLKVGAHLTQPRELELAIRSGVAGALHVPLVDLSPGLIDRAAREGFFFVTTARMWADDPKVSARVCRNVRRLAAAGARLVVGTDAPTFYAERDLVPELERLVECGMSARGALLAATRVAGESLGLGLGTLEPGRPADLVVVGGRPWERIGDLRDVSMVLVQGEVVYERPAVARLDGER